MRDVLIVGGSFAGLAVANQLRGFRVTILDPKPIGSGQTSACGTPLPVLEHWGMTDSVLQVHDRLVLHTGHRTREFRSPYEWCTFDYEKFCQDLFTKSKAEFVQAAATGYRDGRVQTNLGKFNAECIVDASGWRASLASCIPQLFSQKYRSSFGLETTLASSQIREIKGMHFWYDRELLKDSMGWVFPRGESTSFGIGSYKGITRLIEPLKTLTDKFDLTPDKTHGTRIPSELRRPIVGPIFVVGDAAGMCIGLTAEGIRPSLYFGEACGRIIRQVLEGELNLEAGLTKYSEFVEGKRSFFDILFFAQSILTRLPRKSIEWIVRLISNDPLRTWLFEKYWSLTPEWEVSISPSKNKGYLKTQDPEQVPTRFQTGVMVEEHPSSVNIWSGDQPRRE